MALSLGKFVSEIDQMSCSEAQNWALYIAENGPLNPYLRMEAAIGRALLPFLKKGTKLKDVMPWPRDPDSITAPDDFSKQIIEALKATGGGKSARKAKYIVRGKNGRQ